MTSWKMTSWKTSEIARRLAEREDVEPPEGLLDTIKGEIPPVIPGLPALLTPPEDEEEGPRAPRRRTCCWPPRWPPRSLAVPWPACDADRRRRRKRFWKRARPGRFPRPSLICSSTAALSCPGRPRPPGNERGPGAGPTKIKRSPGRTIGCSPCRYRTIYPPRSRPRPRLPRPLRLLR